MFYQGLCPYCSQYGMDWKPMERIDDTITCKKCGKKTELIRVSKNLKSTVPERFLNGRRGSREQDTNNSQ